PAGVPRVLPGARRRPRRAPLFGRQPAARQAARTADRRRVRRPSLQPLDDRLHERSRIVHPDRRRGLLPHLVRAEQSVDGDRRRRRSAGGDPAPRKVLRPDSGAARAPSLAHRRAAADRGEDDRARGQLGAALSRGVPQAGLDRSGRTGLGRSRPRALERPRLAPLPLPGTRQEARGLGEHVLRHPGHQVPPPLGRLRRPRARDRPRQGQGRGALGARALAERRPDRFRARAGETARARLPLARHPEQRRAGAPARRRTALDGRLARGVPLPRSDGRGEPRRRPPGRHPGVRGRQPDGRHGGPHGGFRERGGAGQGDPMTTRALRFVPALAAAAMAFSAAFAPPARAQAQKASELRFPPLPDVPVPAPQRVVLDNGLTVLLLEDRELPLVEATALVRTGAIAEPGDKAGLAELTGRVLRSGGAGRMSGDELDDFLEDRAATIETSISEDTGTARLSALKGNFPDVFRAFTDILRRPAFDAAKIELARNRMVAEVARQNDDPQEILDREFRKLVYGKDSPYARTPSFASLAAIRRADLVAWHGKYFQPDRIVLGIVGDIDAAATLALIKETLGDWPRGPKLQESAPPAPREVRPGVYTIDLDALPQSSIAMGYL